MTDARVITGGHDLELIGGVVTFRDITDDGANERERPIGVFDRKDVLATRVMKSFPYYPLLMDVLEGYAARGMDRSWAELQRTIGVGLNKALLGGDTVETLNQTAAQAFDQAKRAGYSPDKTGPRPQ